jgi:hypothetical protein
MTFTIKKLHLALGVLVVALIAPATALATHVFDDVPDGAFYAGPVEWAADNGITTGKSPTTFDPLAAVTRGESVTFLNRYDTKVVQPATVGLFDSDGDFGPAETTTSTAPVDLGLSATVTVPTGHTGVIEIGFSASSLCEGVNLGWCNVNFLLDGAELVPGTDGFAFDGSDADTEGSSSHESHAMTRVTDELPAGTYVITTAWSVSEAPGSFWLADRTLTAQVHLMS